MPTPLPPLHSGAATVALDPMDQVTTHAQVMEFCQLIIALFNTGSVVNDKTINFNHGLHAAIGLSTEAAEVLDVYKKNMYGKQAPFDYSKLVDEIGDVFFYLLALCMAENIPLSAAMASVAHKLKDRYAAVLAAREQG